MILDVILLLCLIYGFLTGYRKGLLMTLMSLAVLVICFVGAGAAEQALSPRMEASLEQRMAEAIEPKLSEAMDQKTADTIGDLGERSLVLGGAEISLQDVLDMLRDFGIDVEEAAVERTGEALAPVVSDLSREIARGLAARFAGLLIFWGAFLILYLVLQSVLLALNVVDRLPVVHVLNHSAGAVLGLAAAVLVLTAAVHLALRAELLTADSGLLVDLFARLGGLLGG